MHEYHFSDALHCSFEQLAAMHNSSFSGYFRPADMTSVQLSDFWRLNQIDATRCVVMYDQHDTFVGLARMGTRGTRGWCGGFGIVPEFRGTGASKLLAAQMVAVARTSGLTQLQLEVLSQNTAAFKTYQHVGFTTKRRLFGLELPTNALPDRPRQPIQNISVSALLSTIEDGSVQPYWGFELPSTLTKGSEMLSVTDHNGQANTFITEHQGDTIRVRTIHLQPALTNNAFAALLRSVAADAPTIHIFNEPEDSQFLTCYLDLGFKEFFSQYEMFLRL